jgi:hypothetical protein
MPAVIPVILAATAIAGKVAEHRAQGRAAETQLNSERDRIAAQNYATQQQAANQQRQQALDERKFSLNAPSTRLSQLLRGDLIQNATDRHTTVPGIETATTTGGARPSMLSADARSGGGEMVSKALQGLMQGDTFDPQTLLQAPGLTPTPQSGRLDSILGLLGTAGSMAGAAYGARQPGTPAITPGVSPTQLYGSGGGFGGVHF